MKVAIVYYSKHHSNTKKLIDAIAARHDVTVFDASRSKAVDLSNYDMVGFASGIYYSKFHKSVLEFAKQNLPDGKRVFFIYTYGAKMKGYTSAIRDAVLTRNTQIVGEYGCQGYDTFGPFKLIGGVAKGHPNKRDIDNVLAFFESL